MLSRNGRSTFSAYRLVLDGPTMTEPRILSYYSRNQSAFEGGIQGHLRIALGDGRARNALVYALVPPGVEGDFPLHGGEETTEEEPAEELADTGVESAAGVVAAVALLGAGAMLVRSSRLQTRRS